MIRNGKYYFIQEVTDMPKKAKVTVHPAYEIGEIYFTGEGEQVYEQFPEAGEDVNKKTDLILYLK